jgi:hypothetical protein
MGDRHQVLAFVATVTATAAVAAAAALAQSQLLLQVQLPARCLSQLLQQAIQRWQCAQRRRHRQPAGHRETQAAQALPNLQAGRAAGRRVWADSVSNSSSGGHDTCKIPR